MRTEYSTQTGPSAEPRGPLRRFFDSPIAIERGLGVLLWSGLLVVLLTKSSL